MKKKIQENLGTLITVLTIVGIALGAWFKMGETFTPIEKHRLLADKVQQVASNNEKTRLENDLRWFQLQWRTNCKTSAQKRTDHCQWVKAEIAIMQGKLQGLR